MNSSIDQIRQCASVYRMLSSGTSRDTLRICMEGTSLVRRVVRESGTKLEEKPFVIQVSNVEFLGGIEIKNLPTASKITLGKYAFNSDQVKHAAMSLYLTGDYDMREASFFSVLTATSGTIVHEALHLLYTPPADLKSIAVHSLRGISVSSSESMVKLMLSVMNIVEDIFIEALGDANVTDLMFFVRGKNAIYFDDRSVDENIDKYSASPDVATLVNLLTCMKRLVNDRERLGSEPFSSGVLSLCVKRLLSVYDNAISLIDAYGKRVEIAAQVVELIVKNFSLEDVEEGSDAIGEGGQEGTCGEFEMTDEEIEKAVELGDDVELLSKKVDSLVSSHEPREKNMKRINETLVSISETPANDVIVSDKSTVIVYDVEEVFVPILNLLGKEPIRMLEDGWDDFGHRIRSAVSVDRHIEPPQQSGRINGRYLGRLSVDGKILSRTSEISKRSKNWEIIILVDASGSMGRVGEVGALKAAFGVVSSLKACGIKCRLFAHTADYVLKPANLEAISSGRYSGDGLRKREVGTTVIYDFGRATEETVAAFASTIDEVKVLFENRDGDAIKHVVGQFSNKKLARGLIVISDGKPHATGYEGMAAVNLTKKAVDDARNDGIKVVSLSIKEDAIDSNNKIYGTNFNVIASPKSCGTIAEQLITQ